MSKGTDRVRVDFNPDGNPVVRRIKTDAADLIDWIEEMPIPADANMADAGRLKALAQMAIEEGAMWAVKAATT